MRGEDREGRAEFRAAIRQGQARARRDLAETDLLEPLCRGLRLFCELRALVGRGAVTATADHQ